MLPVIGLAQLFYPAIVSDEGYWGDDRKKKRRLPFGHMGKRGNRETEGVMATMREYFSLSGPLHLTVVDWKCANHQRSVAASLVQGVYILERDRQHNRQGPQALAPPWWEFFHFRLRRQLVDDADFSIFGAIYEFKSPPSNSNHSTQDAPRYVIAFRGTITKPYSSRDLILIQDVFLNRLHRSSRFETAIQAVQNMVAHEVGDSNIWLAGHSLGSAMAMLSGKNMAKKGIFLKAFLFNPLYFSTPIEEIKVEKLKQGIRVVSSVIRAGISVALKGNQERSRSDDQFVALSVWVPFLFVNPNDRFCCEYIGYFEHRKKMEEIGAGCVGRVATQNSIRGLFLSAIGNESEPLHLLPSANLTVNLSPSLDFKQAHGIQQWWKLNLSLQSKLYQYR
ncbi:hypothetical protein HHK36_022550 [Tetracentron sinense]|uniref:Fungal lipase-type domain-containing protein n=1 Tax=Tetracentron sinense TaxID=13715 RepID=A0A835D676_TETSI|nr:hypothetical protein HHK36_022550 [Tetracentron sinense]